MIEENEDRMEAVTIKIPVGKILSGTDRKYGGEGDIETLARSIREHGLIHPLAVKENPEDGTYRVIAGRRRYAAVKSLGWKTVEAAVYPEKADEAAVALAENVNRQDMHPLDEAETFKRQLDAGKPVEEIAGYYSRSAAGIYQRVRLVNLSNSLKMFFRDGKINLSGAVILAGLPEEDQDKFFNKYEKKEQEIRLWDVENFVHQVQHCTLTGVCDRECEECKKRTRNTDPSLFDDEDDIGFSDVCFDGECYTKKWREALKKAIEKALETVKPPENKIILGRQVPKFIPRKTVKLTVGGVEYDIVRGDYYTTREAKKKKDTAWEVGLATDKETGEFGVVVNRVSYADRASLYGRSTSVPRDLSAEYGINVLSELTPGEAHEAAKKVGVKYDVWKFNREIRETICDKIIHDRAGATDPEKNYAAVYFLDKFSGENSKGTAVEFSDKENHALFKLTTGLGHIQDIPKDEAVQKLFHFLIVEKLSWSGLPSLEEIKNKFENVENSLFWRYAEISREDYIELYKSAMREIIADV